MKSILAATTVGAFAIGLGAAPGAAQHQHMPGMEVPAPPKTTTQKKPPAKKPVAEKKRALSKPKAMQSKNHNAHAGHAPTSADTGSQPIERGTTPVPGTAEQMSPREHPPQRGAMQAPAPASTTPKTPGADHSQMDHSQMEHGATLPNEHGGHAAMIGAFGSYPAERDSSGTAWQPDTTDHEGWMSTAGDWTLMVHGVLNLIYDHQSGRRGNNEVFASGMLMGMARRPLGNGTLQFKAMVSPDPLMGKSGYPLLLASGETANGTDRLVDRQHPHDFFMELSGSISQSMGPTRNVFLYAGLPGEPAFGPPGFMHREAIMDSPEAPISHHWLDSTHISFGVVTAGIVLDRVRMEVSRFNGREPDQHRWNIETGPLDSTAIRVSWNPTRTISLQGSWGHFEDPEQLEPGVDQRRWSASALWADEVVPGWKLAGTLAWGRKSSKDHRGEWMHDDAFVGEASLKHGGWTIFGRGEITENRELLNVGEHGPAFRVGKMSLGAVHDFRIAEHLTFGAGGLLAVNSVPDELAALYGRRNPIGTMGFLRLKVD